MGDMTLREGKFCKRLKYILESQCAWVFNIHGHGFQKRGVPDLHIVHRRWAGYLELKCQKNKVSQIQKVQGNRLRDRNYPCFVFRCVAAVVHQGVAVSWRYTLEDFNGNVVAKVPNLEGLIDVLVELRGWENFKRQSKG